MARKRGRAFQDVRKVFVSYWFITLRYHFVSAFVSRRTLDKKRQNDLYKLSKLNNDMEIFKKNRLDSFQSYHDGRRPAEVFSELSKACKILDVNMMDTYGDLEKNPTTSFLRRFEAELADEFKTEDAVIMPSGVMAQQISLLIHAEEQRKKRTKQEGYIDALEKERPLFLCHHTSHLLLHENDAYSTLIQMDAHIINTEYDFTAPVSVSPLRFHHVEDALNRILQLNRTVVALIVELPHREIGGKLTPWDDLLKIRKLCVDVGIPMHCDGARIFEASAGYNCMPLKDIAKLFDSIYISLYKGLGGLSGSVLLGSEKFCTNARTWQRRFGGSLYTLLPYAMSGMMGYEKYWKMKHVDGDCVLTFIEKLERLQDIVGELQKNTTVNRIVSFDPIIPETNMVHGYLKYTIDECNRALDRAEKITNIRVLHRLRNIPETHPAHRNGYKCMFEWTIGQSNGVFSNQFYIFAWNAFAEALIVDQ